MTIFNLVSFSAFFLKHDNLVIFEVFENFCSYLGPFYYRCANYNLTVIIRQQDFVEAHRGILLLVKTVYIELPTFLSLKLLACYFYDYVHCLTINFSQFRSAKIRQLIDKTNFPSLFYQKVSPTTRHPSNTTTIWRSF